jgi:DNA-directed RNA polymerase sigma subunit (sigma70/sigma32)
MDKILFNYLDILPIKHATVLKLRFDKNGEVIKTRKEIAMNLGLSQERIRQIEKKSLARLMSRHRIGNTYKIGMI